MTPATAERPRPRHSSASWCRPCFPRFTTALTRAIQNTHCGRLRELPMPGRCRSDAMPRPCRSHGWCWREKRNTAFWSGKEAAMDAKQVVVAYDFSETADVALEHAVDIASREP